MVYIGDSYRYDSLFYIPVKLSTNCQKMTKSVVQDARDDPHNYVRTIIQAMINAQVRKLDLNVKTRTKMRLC